MRRRLCAAWRRLSVANFVVDVSAVPLRLERMLRVGSVGFFMHFHLGYSPEFFNDASGRKSTHMVFREATELMVTIDQLYTSPPLPSFHAPFIWAYPFLWGSALQG